MRKRNKNKHPGYQLYLFASIIGTTFIGIVCLLLCIITRNSLLNILIITASILVSVLYIYYSKKLVYKKLDFIKTLDSNLKHISNGDLENLETNNRLELHRINSYMKKIAENQQLLNDEIESIDKCFVEGNLDERVDENLFNGAYYNFAFSINNIFDSFNWILNSIDLPIIIVNKELDIIYVNESSLKVSKKGKSRIMHKNFYTYFDLGDYSNSDSALRKTAYTGCPFESETMIYVDEKVLDIKYYAVPLKNYEGRMNSILVYIVDNQRAIMQNKKTLLTDSYNRKRIRRLINSIDLYNRSEAPSLSVSGFLK